MIYLDNNATTQVTPQVFAAMRSASDSGHSEATARESIAALLGAAEAEEIFFTSSGTVSNERAILRAFEASPDKDHIITTSVEHDSIQKLCKSLESQGKRVTRLDVEEHGMLDIDTLQRSLDHRTAVVSVMMANHETGILFPVNEIAQIVKEHSDALFHVDGAAAAGKVLVNLKAAEIDLFSISGHKFYGPEGIGALYIRDGVNVQAESAAFGSDLTAGIGAAADLVSDLSAMKAIAEMRDRLESAILAAIPRAFLNGTSDPAKRLPNTTSISFADTNGEMILAMLEAAGIIAATGSACHSQDHKPSAVLQAMNVPYARAMGAIRFSLGRNNTVAEVENVIEVLPGIIDKLRKFGI